MGIEPKLKRLQSFDIWQVTSGDFHSERNAHRAKELASQGGRRIVCGNLKIASCKTARSLLRDRQAGRTRRVRGQAQNDTHLRGWNYVTHKRNPVRNADQIGTRAVLMLSIHHVSRPQVRRRDRPGQEVQDVQGNARPYARATNGNRARRLIVGNDVKVTIIKSASRGSRARRRSEIRCHERRKTCSPIATHAAISARLRAGPGSAQREITVERRAAVTPPAAERINSRPARPGCTAPVNCGQVRARAICS